MSDISQNEIRARTEELKRQEQAYQRQNATVFVNQPPIYDGRLRELFSLVIVNFMLNAVTAGFYRFWAKTRLRHYFLSRISFLNDRLIYTGTGTELFIGFLVVLGILVPFFVGFDFLIKYSMGQGVVMFAIVETAYIVSFMFLFHAAVYRAQRYRLSRVTWRGIRGGQSGSALTYALRAMAWTVAVALTVGLAYPLMRTNLMKYKIDNARFGQQGFHFEGGAGPLYGYWMLPWISLLVMVGGMIALFAMAGTMDMETIFGKKPMDDTDAESLGMTFLKLSPFIYGGLALYFLANFWYRAAEVRYFTGHTTFDEVTFESRLKGLKLFLPYLAYGTLLSLIIGGLIGAVAAGIHYFDFGEMDAEDETTAMVIGFGVIIVMFGVSSLFKPLILQNLLVRIFCNNLTIKGKVESDKLLQSQIQAPRRGEGLADALDVDGF